MIIFSFNDTMTESSIVQNILIILAAKLPSFSQYALASITKKNLRENQGPYVFVVFTPV